MKKITVRILCAALAAAFIFCAAPIGAKGEEKEATVMKIAVFDGVTAKDSAPYDAQALAALFNEAGYTAEVIDVSALSARELFSAKLYDLLMIPTGAAFPYSAVDNFKKFMREGGRLITSGGFAFSELVYPETSGGSVGLGGMIHSDNISQSPCLYRTIPASKFKQGVKYTISLDSRFESISTEKGLAHNSLYVYGAGGSLLSWKDFVAVTNGNSDWDRKTYTFTVPSNADHVDIRLGLYIASGTVYFDNVRISGDDGSEIFFDDMESGIGSWLRTVSSYQVGYGTAEGVFSSSDRVAALYAGTVGTSGCRYDISDAVSGRSSVNVRFSCEYTISGGRVGARVICGEGDERYEINLFTDTSSAGWHDHCVTFEPVAGKSKVYLEFFFENSSGKFFIDELSLTSGETVLLAEHDGELARKTFGDVNATVTSRENDPAYLASNDPTSVGDLLFYDVSTVPLFDTETKYSGAVRISAAEGQEIFKGDVLTDENGISGYSAITWVGNNRGRYQPLLYAYDSLGRKVGVAAAVFRAFYSPSDYGYNGGIKYWDDYKGAGVGFFGVTDRDLFAPGNTALREGLVKLADTLCGKIYICSADNAYDCYRPGEKPRVSVVLENPVAETLECFATVKISSEDTGETVYEETKSVKIPRHAKRTLRFDVTELDLTADDFWYVSVTLECGGEVVDSYESGFVVWDEETVAAGPKYTYHDNYIYLVQPDGTEKAVFISGVDDGGNTFVNEDQTPLVWKSDFERRRDAGILLYENLQQYRDYGDFSRVFDNGYPTERHMSKVDCAVYLAQKYGQIYMMGMLLGANCGVDDAQLEKDKEYISKMAARYKDVPGVIYYLNGDLIVKPTSAINQLYREFLKQRYGTDEKLAECRPDLKSIESAKYDSNYSFTGSGWSDRKAYDQNLFRTYLIKRWANALTAVAKEAGGADKAVLCEFFSWPSESIDVEHAIGDLTYSNIGFFDKLEMLTETLANADQRVRGKSFGIGESNKRTHPDFGETLDYYASGSERYSEAYLRSVFYNTLAMGGNHYQVWCFKDETKYNFPWGLTYMVSAGERNIFNIYRNLNILTSTVEPTYVSPEVAFLTPDSLRMSGSRGWYVGHYATLRGIDMAQTLLADNILTINENDLIIPESVKVIYYPLAFTVPENVCNALTEFVKNGGTLYISGDPAYELDTRTREYGDRAERLTGTKVTKVIYAGVDDAGADVTYTTDAGKRAGKPCVRIELAGAKAIYSDTTGSPVFTEYSLGSGKVYYSTVPVEIASNTSTYLADVDLYEKVLAGSGLRYNAVSGSAAGLRTSVLPLAGGGTLRVISNSSNIDIKTEYKSGETTYSFRLGGWQTAAFVEDAEGRLVTLDVPTAVQKNGERFMTNDCAAVLVPLDGALLENTGVLAVLPDSSGGFSCYCGAWKDPVAVRGSVYYGEFLNGGEISVTYKGGRLSIDSAREGEIIIVCEKGGEENAVSALLGTLGISASEKTPAETSSGDTESGEPGETEGGSSALPFIIAGAAAALIAAAAAVIIVKRKKSK